MLIFNAFEILNKKEILGSVFPLSARAMLGCSVFILFASCFWVRHFETLALKISVPISIASSFSFFGGKTSASFLVWYFMI